MSAIRCYVCGVPLHHLLAAMGRRRCPRCIERHKETQAARHAARLEALRVIASLRVVRVVPGSRPEKADPIRHPLDADDVRELRCANYNACLSVAVAHEWPGFKCGAGCRAYREIDMAQARQDIEGMAEMIAAAVRA